LDYLTTHTSLSPRWVR